MILWQEIVKAFIDLGNSEVFFIFIVVVGLDVISGKSRAVLEKETNSYTGVRGLIKHSVVILIQVAIGIVARLLDYVELSVMMCWFFISDYGLSLYANLTMMGVPLPELDVIKKEIEMKTNREGDK